MKQSTYNPYGVKDRAAFERLFRLAVWICPLISLALYFLVYQLLVANGAPSFLVTTVFYLTEAVSTAALFATLALLVLSVTHEETALRRRLLIAESVSLLAISFVLRIGLYILTAFFDHLGFLGGFYLNDVTISYIFDKGAFNFRMKLVLPTFFGILSMLFVILLSLFLVKRSYQKGLRGKTGEHTRKIPILVYLGVSVSFALINTVMTIVDIGFAFTFPVVFTILLPYIEIAVLTFIGQYVVDEIVSRLDG